MTDRPRIRVLSDAVINKIAAGEVVERPASVLKELIENALDAEAARIEASVVGGGREAIVVSDDGYGMSPDDALLALERHATSKIAEVEDIERIGTFGFRGEALAAIAAVSRLTLRTCARGADQGVEISAVGGRIQDVVAVGGPPGTVVAVRNLFFNVPARRKFLRSDATELSQIRQVFLLYALANPNVHMTLRVDDREIYRVAPGHSPSDRIRELFPNVPMDQLRAVDGTREGVRVSGYVGLPALSRGDRTEQYLFVNRRPVSSAQLQSALNEVYQTLLPRGRYPVVFLFVELPSEEVDVNVHPTKKEVRFRNGGKVRDVVIAFVRAALTAPVDRSTPRLVGTVAAIPTPSPLTQAVSPIADLPPPRAFVYPRRSLSPFPASPEGGLAAASAAPASSSAPLTVSSPWSWCRVLGQVGGLYVVLETEDGLVLMDPHAAHERVLYERLMKEVTSGTCASQGLLAPETVEMPPALAPLVRQNLDTLSQMGFGVAEFGGDTFIVDAVPAVLGPLSARILLMEAARTVEEGGERGGVERWSIERVARAACRAAVKARDTMSLEELERLVVDLAGCEMPYTCPHGRPTLIHMSFSELNRKFGRA